MRIAAVDLGHTAGLVVGDTPSSFCVHLLHQKSSSKWEGEHYQNFQDNLTQCCSEGVEAIFYEKVARHAGTRAAHVYGAYEALLQLWATNMRIHTHGIPVGTIKKHLTGSGNATKEEMVEGIQKKGHAITDHNEADALALYFYAHALLRTTE